MALIKLNNNSISAVSALPSGVGGKVLQVVLSSDSTSYGTTSSSYQQALQSSSITLNNSSNKVLVIANFVQWAAGTNSVYSSLYRGAVSGGTRIGGSGDGMIQNSGASGASYRGVNLVWLDTPGGNTTYSIGYHSESGLGTNIRGDLHKNLITLIEIEA